MSPDTQNINAADDSYEDDDFPSSGEIQLAEPDVVAVTPIAAPPVPAAPASPVPAAVAPVMTESVVPQPVSAPTPAAVVTQSPAVPEVTQPAPAIPPVAAMEPVQASVVAQPAPPVAVPDVVPAPVVPAPVAAEPVVPAALQPLVQPPVEPVVPVPPVSAVPAAPVTPAAPVEPVSVPAPQQPIAPVPVTAAPVVVSESPVQPVTAAPQPPVSAAPLPVIDQQQIPASAPLPTVAAPTPLPADPVVSASAPLAPAVPAPAAPVAPPVPVVSAPAPPPQPPAPPPLPQPSGAPVATSNVPVPATLQTQATTPKKKDPSLRIIEPPASGMQMLDKTDFALQGVGAQTVLAGSKSSQTADGSDIELMDDIDSEVGGFMADKHQQRVEESGLEVKKKPHLAVRLPHWLNARLILSTTLTTALVIGSTWLYMADRVQRGEPPLHFAAGETDGVFGFINGLFVKKPTDFQWTAEVFDGSTQSEVNKSVFSLAPDEARNIELTAGTCQLPPVNKKIEEQPERRVLRAQRSVVCLGGLTVESSGKGTTDCTETSNGDRYEDNDTYTVKNEDGETVGTIIYRCKFMSDDFILPQAGIGEEAPPTDTDQPDEAADESSGFFGGLGKVFDVGGTVTIGMDAQMKARNERRKREISNIINGLSRYQINNRGQLPIPVADGVTLELCAVPDCRGGVYLGDEFFDASIVDMPRDPSVDDDDELSGYTLQVNDERLTVSAPLAEGGVIISVTQ